MRKPTRRRIPSPGPPLQKPLVGPAGLKPEHLKGIHPVLWPQVFAAAHLLDTPGGESFARVVRSCWSTICELVARIPWQDRRVVSHSQLIPLAFGIDEEVRFATLAFIGLLPPSVPSGMRFLAYIGRLVLRGVSEPKMTIKEMALASLGMHAAEEFHRRAQEHPMGALLFAAATAPPPGPSGSEAPRAEAQILSEATSPIRKMIQGGGEEAAARWLRKTAKQVPVKRARSKTGEANLPADRGPMAFRGLEDAAVGPLGRDLAEELERLRQEPPELLATELLSGRLNYHRKMAEQTLADEWRRYPPHKRPVLTEDLDAAPDRDRHQRLVEKDAHVVGPRGGAHARPRLEAPDPLKEAERQEEEQRWDPDAIADRIARQYELTEKRPLTDATRRVLRIHCRNPKKPLNVIAEEAGTSAKTASRALSKIKKLGERSLRRTLYSS